MYSRDRKRPVEGSLHVKLLGNLPSFASLVFFFYVVTCNFPDIVAICQNTLNTLSFKFSVFSEWMDVTVYMYFFFSCLFFAGSFTRPQSTWILCSCHPTPQCRRWATEDVPLLRYVIVLYYKLKQTHFPYLLLRFPGVLFFVKTANLSLCLICPLNAVQPHRINEEFR